MPNELTLDQAADALRCHYGGKGLEAGHDEGYALLSEALREEAGIPKEQADSLIHQLDAAHVIRWIAHETMGSNNKPGSGTTIPKTAAPQDHGTADLGARGLWQV